MPKNLNLNLYALHASVHTQLGKQFAYIKNQVYACGCVVRLCF